MRNLDGKYGLEITDIWLLKDGDVIRACFALWDQRRIKQTVVRSYRYPLNQLRVLYNLFARLRHRVRLPAPGRPIDYIFIAFMAIDKIAYPLVDHILSEALYRVRERGVGVAMLGCSALNPMLQQLEKFPQERYSTYIYKVEWLGESSVVLDDKPVQPEIAIL